MTNIGGPRSSRCRLIKSYVNLVLKRSCCRNHFLPHTAQYPNLQQLYRRCQLHPSLVKESGIRFTVGDLNIIHSFSHWQARWKVRRWEDVRRRSWLLKFDWPWPERMYGDVGYYVTQLLSHHDIFTGTSTRLPRVCALTWCTARVSSIPQSGPSLSTTGGTARSCETGHSTRTIRGKHA